MSKWADEFCSQFKTIGDIQKHTSQNKLLPSLPQSSKAPHFRTPPFQSRASGSGKKNYTLPTLQGMSPARRKKVGEGEGLFLFLSEKLLSDYLIVSSQEAK